MISGVVARSPFFVQTNPVPKILRRIGEPIATVFPYLTIPAPVPVEVRSARCKIRIRVDVR